MNKNECIRLLVNNSVYIFKNILTKDQKKIIFAVLKDRNIKAYEGKDIIKVFIKK